jgi:transcription antitermination factor NusG
MQSGEKRQNSIPTVAHFLPSRIERIDDHQRDWHAVFTVPNNERAVARRLIDSAIETFLPTYETVRVWKNRQRVTVTLPLFPSYLFVRIGRTERHRVLGDPGVIRLVGRPGEYSSIPDDEISFLQSTARTHMEPIQDFVIGERVRVRHGSMKGVEGILSRANNRYRFILTIWQLNLHVAVEVNVNDIERITHERAERQS